MGDDTRQVGGRHWSAEELHLCAEVRALVEQDDADLAAAHRLHRLAETVATGNEAHAEALAGCFDPDFGGGEVEWSVKRHPFASAQIGVE